MKNSFKNFKLVILYFAGFKIALGTEWHFTDLRIHMGKAEFALSSQLFKASIKFTSKEMTHFQPVSFYSI